MNIEKETNLKAHAEKPSVFETMKDSFKEEEKPVNKRSEARNESSLIRSVHQQYKIT